MMPSGEFSGWLAERSALCAAFRNAQLGLGRIGTALRLACGPVIPAISRRLRCCSKELGPLPAHTHKGSLACASRALRPQAVTAGALCDGTGQRLRLWRPADGLHPAGAGRCRAAAAGERARAARWVQLELGGGDCERVCWLDRVLIPF